MACYKDIHGHTACIIRGMESILSQLGEPFTNELDCPLLNLTHTLFTTRTNHVMRAVSIVHECTTACKFVEREYPRCVEREAVDLSSTRIEQEHDYSNYMYCFNVYCMISN